MADDRRFTRRPPLSAQVASADGHVDVALLGELDVATLPVAERVLAEAQVRGARRLVLDLSGVTFLDLSGLRLLFSAHDRWGSALEIVGGPREVTQVVAFSGLSSRLSPADPHRAGRWPGRFSRGH